MIDDDDDDDDDNNNNNDEHREVGGVLFKGDQSARIKPAPVPLCPP
jgi:hypothetical protein